jgi:mono/diheme cytochrome c family protein
MKPKRIAVTAGLVFLLALGVILVSRFSLSALPEPGPSETAAANAAKRFLIARASRGSPPEPETSPASIAEGQKRFGVECSMCHGFEWPHADGQWALDVPSRSRLDVRSGSEIQRSRVVLDH